MSPRCLGTMTFGTEWGWGSPKETAHRMLARYLELDRTEFFFEGMHGAGATVRAEPRGFRQP